MATKRPTFTMYTYTHAHTFGNNSQPMLLQQATQNETNCTRHAYLRLHTKNIPKQNKNYNYTLYMYIYLYLYERAYRKEEGCPPTSNTPASMLHIQLKFWTNDDSQTRRRQQKSRPSSHLLKTQPTVSRQGHLQWWTPFYCGSRRWWANEECHQRGSRCRLL